MFFKQARCYAFTLKAARPKKHVQDLESGRKVLRSTIIMVGLGVVWVFFVLFPVPFFAIPNIFLAFWTTAKQRIDVFVEASLTASQGCCRGVAASWDPTISPRVTQGTYLHWGSSALLLPGHSASRCPPSSCLRADSNLCNFYSCPFLEHFWECCIMLVEGLCSLSPTTMRSEPSFLSFASHLFMRYLSTWEAASLPTHLNFFESFC